MVLTCHVHFVSVLCSGVSIYCRVCLGRRREGGYRWLMPSRRRGDTTLNSFIYLLFFFLFARDLYFAICYKSYIYGALPMISNTFELVSVLGIFWYYPLGMDNGHSLQVWCIVNLCTSRSDYYYKAIMHSGLKVGTAVTQYNWDLHPCFTVDDAICDVYGLF